MSRRFPTGAEYVDALQNTGLCFRDPQLRGAVPELDRLGRPKAISGAFASVFSLSPSTGSRFAVKCFTREVPDQGARYQAISDHLSTLEHPWKVGFDYLPEGILVAGSWYPILKMEWATGVGLTRWLDQNHHDGPALVLLAERFAELVSDLSAAGIGHGDLQHGNLLVAPDRSLRLVDYDGMYVPALSGFDASELGHRNYQSPARSSADFGPYIDRFSAWVIYFSLIAVAAKPALWNEFHEQDGEYLLLAEEDFKSPATSSRLSELLAHPAAEVREMAGRVRDFSVLRTSHLPELVPVSARSAGAAAQSMGPVPTQGLPAWMADHVAPATSDPPVGFAGRRFPIIAVVLVIAMVVVPLSVAAAVLTTQAAILVMGLSACALALGANYRLRPEALAARRARARLTETRAQVASPESALQSLEKERVTFDQHAKRRTEEFGRRARELDDAATRSVQRAERDLQQRLARLNSSVQDLSRLRQRDLEKALAKFQQEHVRAKLLRVKLLTGSVSGVGYKAVDRLRANGITTAADFTGIDLSTSRGHYQNVVARFVLAGSGRPVRVDGIGEVKALALNEWRLRHLEKARKSQPMSLPHDKRAAILVKYEKRETALHAEMRTAEENATAARKMATQSFGLDKTQLADERRRVDLEIIRLRADLNQRISAAMSGRDNVQRTVKSAESEAARYRGITFRGYLVFLLVG